MARLHSRYAGYPGHLSLRWTDPRGRVVAETEVESYGRPWIGSALDLPDDRAAGTGRWTVEVRYERDLLERTSFRLQPSR